MGILELNIRNYIHYGATSAQENVHDAQFLVHVVLLILRASQVPEDTPEVRSSP